MSKLSFSTDFAAWVDGSPSGRIFETTGKRLQEVKLIYRRTFLSWLHFAVVLGGLAVGLLNFGDKVSCYVLSYERRSLRSGRQDLCRHVHRHRYVLS